MHRGITRFMLVFRRIRAQSFPPPSPINPYKIGCAATIMRHGLELRTMEIMILTEWIFGVVNASSDVANVVFWNPETAVQQVNFEVSRDWYESNPTGYYAGIALMAAGVLVFLPLPLYGPLKIGLKKP